MNGLYLNRSTITCLTALRENLLPFSTRIAVPAGLALVFSTNQIFCEPQLKILATADNTLTRQTNRIIRRLMVFTVQAGSPPRDPAVETCPGPEAETRTGRKSFIEEYESVLKEFEIDYDERFVFKPFDYHVADGTS